MNIAVAQSGGPTCAINASLVGVFGNPSRNLQLMRFLALSTV